MEKETQISLLGPLELKGLQLKNRIVMAPMTRSRALGHIPNDLMVTYYGQRASAGLIITEGTSPSPNGLGYARTPAVYSQEQIQAWRKITSEIHKKEGKIFLQILHVGRIAHKANTPEEAEILAPSAIAAKGEMWTDSLGMQLLPTPKAMTTEEVYDAIDEFTQGALNAIEAGFDGIELHGANGYLIEQFLNPHSNQRADEFGGSVEKRAHFLLELLKSVVQAIGKEKVGLRLSPYSTFNDMPNYPEIPETYEYLLNELNSLDIVYLHISEYAAKQVQEGNQLIGTIRRGFKNTYIANGGYDKERAEDAIAEGKADLVAFGTPFISNPDLPRRFKENVLLTSPDPATFYAGGEKGYIDYAFYKN